MKIKYIISFLVVSSVYCSPSFLGSGVKDVDLVGESYVEAVDLLVFQWNGRLMGDYVVRDKKTGDKFLKEDVLLKNQSAINFMKEEFGESLARISFIAEYNRVHLFALDKEFNVLGHIINHSDAFFIPGSGPLKQPE